METLLQDLRHALRMLRRNPGFTLTAIAALALGIGANTAIFSVVYTVLLKPLPFPDADRIVLLMNTSPQGSFAAASVPKYNFFAQSPVVTDAAAYDLGGPGINITGGDRPEQARGIHVSRQFFPLFGARMAAGRGFSADEDRPGGGKVVVLGNGLWKRRYGADPAVVGKTISLGGDPHTIIGVLAPDFAFEPPADLYLPFQADPHSTQQAHFFRAAARLKRDVQLETAQAALRVTADQFRARFPAAMGPNNSFSLEPMQSIVVRNVRPALLILLGAVAFVLLIACANVANLLLARSAARSREMALRAALGAGRQRIVRQLLTESVLLSVAGGVLGMALGFVGVRALLAVNPGNIPRIGVDGSAVNLDWAMLAFSAGLSIFTGILFGLAPALHASRGDLSLVLNESGARSGGGARQNRARAVLVITEIALASVLLVGAGLLIRTFAALHTVEPGFDARNVLTMETSFTGGRWDKTAAVSDLARQAIERIEALPGVQAAAASCYLPLEGGLGLGFVIAGRPLTNGPAHGGGGWAYVTPHFFDAFKVPLKRGRVFTERDSADAPGVVVINEAMARQFWPKEDPLGARITIGPTMGPEFAEAPREIIGIVADARDAGLNEDPQPQMFVPVAQVRDSVMTLNNRFLAMNWVVRTTGAPFGVSAPAQKVFHELADLPLAHIRSMDQVVVQSTARERFNTLLLGVFAFTAILLASIGLYGLISYSVQQRTVEFGIRLALGAESSRVRNMIVRQALTLASAGIVVGLGAAFGLTRLMETLLFGVRPRDPLVFGTVTAVLALVALLAAYIPARRAVRIEPVQALRYE